MGDNANLDDREKPENRRALDLALDDKHATIETILTAAGQAMDIDQNRFGKLVATLDRLHASADDVISLSQVNGIHVEDMLELLLRARGVTATHVQVFLAEHDGFELLKKDKPRMAVQRMAGMPSLLQLMGPSPDSRIHDVIVASPSMFTWFMKGEVAPEDLLWLCASNPHVAARATRLVAAQVGFTWVHRLLTLEQGKDGLLRTFALYCHDEPTAAYVREHLLGDPPFGDKTTTKGSQPTDPATRSGQGGRFIDALSEYGSPAEIIARLGDLDEPVRFGLGRDDAAVAPIAQDLTGDLYARAARMLDLTFERTIRHSPAPSSATLAYLASRPHAEQLAALRSADFALVAQTVHPNLLLVFPSLADPAVLAGLIGRPPLLALLLEGSDPGRIAALIGADPVRGAAQPMLDQHPELLGRLPHYKELAPAAQHGVDELAKHSDPDGDDVRESLDEDSKQPGVEHQARRLRDARKAKTLVEALETLGTQHAKGEHRIDDNHDPEARPEHAREQHVSETNALAILEQHRAEVPELLNEPSHRPSVMKLAGLLDLPPNVAIPWLDATALARMPNAVAWWMAFRDPLALLHQLVNAPQAIAVVAGAISANTMGAMQWLARLPKGFELDSLEDRVIEQLRALLRANSAGLHALFRIRFGMPPPAGYDIKLTNQLWDVIGRLPPDQLKQERISKFDAVPRDEMDAAGLYSPGDGRIDIATELEQGKQKDAFYSVAHEAWYTRSELQQAFGYSDAAFDQLASQGRFEVRTATVGPMPTTQYRMKEQIADLFTQVVLHEVGHSVDDMLGSRTPPVWDYAGWHEYSNATFGQWAAEMGGWDEVSAADQKSIQEAWISAMGGKVAVDTLVDAEHPAVNTTKYKKVGLVTLGAAGKRLGYAERTQIGDRIFIAGTVEDSLFSVKASAAAVAPSDYSLNAPAEYFAESYVEYYRGADGSPGSQDRKGGALASPVKQWFDEHVDRLKYDPKRFRGGASEQMHDAGEQPMQANNAPAQAPERT
ncbi:MAG: hypothetical protein ABI437_21855 [Kofleriaceae bacterium]